MVNGQPKAENGRRPIFALVDCNNFFVSCERLFRPDLEGKPVIVLSSNDGCAVSRSNEAKALGIPMGAPAFKFRDLFKQHDVKQFSANFDLYGDLSERMTTLLIGVTPRTEVYSVDESFLDLSQLGITDYTKWARELKQRIMKEVGIPVSIGIAASKTLAKLGSDRSKKDPELNGVLDLYSISGAERAVYLERTPVGDVWGIGRRLAPRMKAEGVFTAQGLANMRPKLAQSLMGINGRQLVAELNGASCHPLERIGRKRKTIMHGRMFGQDTTDISSVEAAVANFTARIGFDLRREGLLTRSGVVMLSTSRFKPGYTYQEQAIKFSTPTADTGAMVAAAVSAARELFRSSISYHRVNVLFFDFIEESAVQTDLLGYVDIKAHDASKSRMAAFDKINRRYGKQTIRIAAEDLSQAWEPKRQHRSPRYTSNWNELPIARIK